MNEFHFLRPHVLWLLIPLLFGAWMLWNRKRSSGIWEKLCAKHLLPYILETHSALSKLPIVLLTLTGILTITALAGPSWQKESLPLIKRKSGLVIALNLSPSINAEDIKPSRLQRARYKINDILKLRNEGQTALVVYSDEAFVVTPLTEDTKTISNLLPSLDTSIMPTQGLKHEKGVEKATELFRQANITDASILLITSEGSDSAISSTIPVSILGVGTEEGAPVPRGNGSFLKDSTGNTLLSKLNATLLAKMAKATGGRYAAITVDDSDIHYLLDGMEKSQGYDLIDTDAHVKSMDGGYWLILLALPLAAFLVKRGGYLTLALVLPSIHLQAFSWQDLWLTPDQQGRRSFEQEAYHQASQYFQDPNWQAAAYYKNQNYEEAIQRYKNDETADGHYNLANALAMQGHIDKAIAEYEKALELQPDHEDAAYNKALLEKQKEENPQNKNDQDNKEEQQQKDQGNDKSNPQSQDGQKDPQQSNNENDKNNDQPQPDKGEQQQDEQESHKSLQKDSNKEQESQVSESEEAEHDPQRDIDDRWLHVIPDDPGALLRRKFMYQYKNQKP